MTAEQENQLKTSAEDGPLLSIELTRQDCALLLQALGAYQHHTHFLRLYTRLQHTMENSIKTEGT